MVDNKSKLTRKQEEAIVALLSNRSMEDVARACNIPARTLYRWLKDGAFDAAYRQARRDADGPGEDDLRAVGGEAIGDVVYSRLRLMRQLRKAGAIGTQCVHVRRDTRPLCLWTADHDLRAVRGPVELSRDSHPPRRDLLHAAPVDVDDERCRLLFRDRPHEDDPPAVGRKRGTAVAATRVLAGSLVMRHLPEPAATSMLLFHQES